MRRDYQCREAGFSATLTNAYTRIALSCAALLATGACAGSEQAETTNGISSHTTGVVIRVIDGDSVAMEVEGTVHEVRLVGLNAPEFDECFGSDARHALKALLATNVVTLEQAIGHTDIDRFGRLLRYVYADGEFINKSLITAGYATALDSPHTHNDNFAALEDTAYAEQRGMWAVDACSAPGSTDIAIAEVQYNPIRDELDGEYIELEHRGKGSIDLSGWIIRDASSVNRFVFPNGSVLRGGTSIKIWSKCDTDSGLAWCADGPVWNNNGDSAILQTPQGSVVDRFRYSGIK